MTAHPPASPEAIAAAGAIYGAILADPERAEQIRAARERDDAENHARPSSTNSTRKSA